jgi:hypothetical protein
MLRRPIRVEYDGIRCTLGPLPPVRVMLASLLVLAAFAAGAPGSALALTKAERKAVTVKSIDGASTATSAFVEITFKGQFEEMFGTRRLRNGSVKVQFVPASGKRTTITETGPADAPETTRRGTKGFSETVRAGRTFSVLVRGLKAPAEKVIVKTTSRKKKKSKVDKQKGPLSTPVTEAELDLELDEVDLMFSEAIDTATDADYARYARQERIALLKEDLRNAKTRAEKRKARKQLAKQKAKVADLRAIAKAQNAKVDLIERWIKLLEKALKGPAARECNDGVDNGDPEDSLVDFGLDPGCVMRLDADEDDVGMPLTCPSPGNTASVTGKITIPQSYKLDSFYVSLPPPAAGEPRDGLIDAPVTASSGGPYPVTWYKALPCGPEIDMSYGYALFTAGAPQGEYGLRVAVTAESPPTTQNQGGQHLSLRLAAGTSR